MLKRTKTNLWVHGIIMLAIAVFCFLMPQNTVATLGIILGVAFIAAGVLTFLVGRKRSDGGVDMLHLIAALLMALVGIVVLVRPNILAVLAGLVILLEGIDFVIQAIRYHRAGVKLWGALLAAGLLAILLGLWAVMSQWVATTLLSVIIGVGCLSVSADCFMALAGIGQVENFVSGVRNVLNGRDTIQEAQVVEEEKE